MELEPRQAEPELLSQDEVERVLVQACDEQRQSLVHRRGGRKEQCPSQSFQTHDFRAPSFLSPSQWRKLRLEHEGLASGLAGRLSNYLRLDVGLRLTRLETQLFRDWVGNLNEPTHLSIFKLEPLRGLGLLEIQPHLGLSLVDRLLGGPGHASVVSRQLSDIDVALLDQVLMLFLDSWAQLWNNEPPLRPTILGHESSGRYLQSASADTQLLSLGLEVRLGNFTEELNLAFPCAGLEALLRQKLPPLQAASSQSPKTPAPQPKWNPSFNSLKVPLAAQWPQRQLSARQLTQLKVGDVLEWDPAAASQIQLRLAQTAKFVGRLGTQEGRWAIEITGLLPAQSD